MKLRLSPFTDARVYAVLRVLFGLLSFWCLASIFPHSAEFFSADGWLPPKVGLDTENIRTWSVFFLGHTPLYTWAFMTIAIVASITMTIGLWSRTSVWVTFIFLASASVRNHFVFSGEDCLLRNFLFLIAFSRCGDVWSFDSWWAKKKTGIAATEHTPVAPAWPMRLMQFQVCVLYLSSGLAKQRGTDWLTGVATVRALLNPVVSRYSYEFLNHFSGLLQSDFFKVCEQVTLYWEVCFPFLMMQRHLRYAALAFGVIAHASIFVLFQVHFFSFAMVATYLCIVPSAWTVRAFTPLMNRIAGRWDSFFVFQKKTRPRLRIEEGRKKKRVA